MTNDKNWFKDAQERVFQEERRRIRDENRENDRQRKIAARRQIVIGEIVSKYFPDVKNLQPGLKRTDTDVTFAGLDEFFSRVASNPNLSMLFQKLVSKENVGENRQKQ